MAKAVVTDSLETPVMEMKDPWGPQSVKTSSSNEEENTVFSIWEENYQDLSNFCMGAFQGQCAFLIGESEATAYLGGKIDDKSVSTTLGTVEVGQGVTYGSKTLEENKDIMEGGRDIINTQMIHKYKPKEEKIDESADIPDVWLDSPKSSIALRTDEWIKLEDSDRVDEPLPRENWDGINTFDNTGLNSFDLLSYLCDDEIQSQDGSVSTDSASVSTQNLLQHPTFSNVKPIKIEGKPETITSLSLSGSSAHLDSSRPSSSRTTRARSTPKRFKTEPTIEPTYARTTNRGKKRSLESDSDDRMSDCSYRENREKNNEASRKSRMNKKAKESEMMARAGQLEKDNRLLKMKVEALEKMVTSLRAAILQSALKK
ncbi:uncharacterized protein LOC107041263 [Diachasma alloeum]|uniref:uncharacterized protein LOC107041263 n=1 Tax=Diachasma alloeum TaxID=454923 RepID=UPI0007381585|nr:uncharacterized protein LOC107041263 [Diachasma alloeum]XP_015117219.1 uncharacterized protein LOC107041263 [Diachasma alloeum]